MQILDRPRSPVATTTAQQPSRVLATAAPPASPGYTGVTPAATSWSPARAAHPTADARVRRCFRFEQPFGEPRPPDHLPRPFRSRFRAARPLTPLRLGWSW